MSEKVKHWDAVVDFSKTKVLYIESDGGDIVFRADHEKIVGRVKELEVAMRRALHTPREDRPMKIIQDALFQVGEFTPPCTCKYSLFENDEDYCRNCGGRVEVG